MKKDKYLFGKHQHQVIKEDARRLVGELYRQSKGYADWYPILYWYMPEQKHPGVRFWMIDNEGKPLELSRIVALALDLPYSPFHGITDLVDDMRESLEQLAYGDGVVTFRLEQRMMPVQHTDLTRAENLSGGGWVSARITIDGDLQLSCSEAQRLELLEYLYENCWRSGWMTDDFLPSGNERMLNRLEIADLESLLAHIEATTPESLANRSLGWAEDEVLNALCENNFDELDRIAPEEIAALTEAPILGIRDENIIPSYVWWYPNYAVDSFVEDLLINGYTIFKKGE